MRVNLSSNYFSRTRFKVDHRWKQSRRRRFWRHGITLRCWVSTSLLTKQIESWRTFLKMRNSHRVKNCSYWKCSSSRTITLISMQKQALLPHQWAQEVDHQMRKILKSNSVSSRSVNSKTLLSIKLEISRFTQEVKMDTVMRRNCSRFLSMNEWKRQNITIILLSALQFMQTSTSGECLELASRKTYNVRSKASVWEVSAKERL